MLVVVVFLCVECMMIFIVRRGIFSSSFFFLAYMCIHNLFIERFSSYKNNTREKAVSALERDEIENLWLLSVDFQDNVYQRFPLMNEH